MARRTLRQLLNDMTPVQRLVFDATRQTEDNANAYTRVINQARRGEYEAELNRLSDQVGCQETSGQIRNPAITREIRNQSRRDARSVVRTYNMNLAHAIINVGGETPTANRNTYAARLRTWEGNRAEHKDPQIAANTHLTAVNKAQDDFYDNNPVRGVAQLAGPDPAAEPICQGWLNRGVVPANVARRNPSPFHINCLHLWEYQLRKPQALDCEDLWLGGST